ncbi:uncharacterized protein LOC125030634 [Penaeus chinensis]|uniref:uncharacterized protein LOC125030634 n=1 Tax=Penaeus chinensis TaxID=139456 RepID=UPI001FB5BF7E|nr:uncharacterized protein LOC125030634 [Penaeus chinensis]
MEAPASQVPVWTEAAWRSSFLDEGCFGVANLVWNGLERASKDLEKKPGSSLEVAAMEALLKELQASQVPVWSEADYLERMAAWRSSFLDEGGFGVARLVWNGLEQLVVKQIKRKDEESFVREVRALSKVRGMDGM